jgi:hypothetical protein
VIDVCRRCCWFPIGDQLSSTAPFRYMFRAKHAELLLSDNNSEFPRISTLASFDADDSTTELDIYTIG